MRLSFGRVLLPLLLVGACSFPEYAFAPTDLTAGGSAGTGESAGAPAAAGTAGVTVSACEDGLQGANETGIDCGGECKPCERPLPTCADGMQGDHETGIDCGGVCAGCADYANCTTGADCASASCKLNVCQPPQCNDKIANGTESDQDCGGHCPALCQTDQRCNTMADCVSGVCSASKCRAATCKDNVLNGDESDVDCGGSACPSCALGKNCRVTADCGNQSCDSKQLLCVIPKCQDMVKNNSETDLDCGGDCAPCVPGQHCAKNSDCSSGSCNSSKLCAVATCADAVVNQDESDTDCGGPNCKHCENNRICKVASDCVSGACQTTAKLCVPATATGARLDQSGWVATASDTFYDSSTKSLIDGDPSNRWTSGTHQDTGMWIKLDMAKQQVFFTVTLDTTNWPGDSGKSYNVFVSPIDNFTGVQPKAFVAGKAVQALTFDSAMVGRYIMIELTTPGQEWWSVGELVVTQ